MPVVKFEEGTVSFKVKKLPGCCGIGVIFHPRFMVLVEKRLYDLSYPEGAHVRVRKLLNSQGKKLYAALHKHVAGPRKLGSNGLSTKEWPFDLDRSRLMMTDNSYGAVYQFCTYNKWKKVKTFKNYKTGHVLHTFYLDRR